MLKFFTLLIPFVFAGLLGMTAYLWAAEQEDAEAQPEPSAEEAPLPPTWILPDQEKIRSDEVKRYLKQHQREDEIIELNANNETFLGLWLPQRTTKPQGAALILPDNGEHGQWPDTVAPLREYLPDYGWATLSIQLPEVPPRLAPDATDTTPAERYHQQMLARISAGVRYLQDQRQLNLVIIANGHSAGWAGAWLAEQNIGANNEKGMAFILVDAVNDAYAPNPLTATLKNFSFPMLDIISPANRNSAFINLKRQGAMRLAKHSDYQQLQLIALDLSAHDSNGLLRQIRGWLKTKLAGDERKVKPVAGSFAP